jgi:pimeloyl-ACP methyl ester carboxylesterase
MSHTVVLVHGAFAESSSWNGVIDAIQADGHHVVAVANPLRGLASDAAAVSDVVRSIEGPIVLAAHSYGGAVITNVAADAGQIIGLVYVSAFAPDTGESAFQLSTMFPGSTLGDALVAYPVRSGGDELAIKQELFHRQFAAEVAGEVAALMAVTQRPATQTALSTGLPTDLPAWRTIPSWFVFGDQDLNIPVALHRFLAERAGPKGTREVAGGSHALLVSEPDAVAATILDALAAM